MSSNDPPTFNTSIFNATAFIDTSETLTLGDANSKYLSKENPSGSGTLSIPKISLNSTNNNALSITNTASAGLSNLSFTTNNTTWEVGGRSSGAFAPNLFYIYGNSAFRFVINSSGNVGIGTTNPAYQLELTTDSAGKPTTNTWTTTSDERVKEDIKDADLDICYNNVKNLKLKYFKWKDDFIDDHLVEDKHKLGWIAQEVETVIPKAVITTKNEKYEIDDFKSLNSDQIIACLYGAVQKLIEKNEKLEEFISRLDIEEE